MADQIEFFVKMNRLVQPIDRNALLPVRFKPVFYDPNMADERPLEEDDEELSVSAEGRLEASDSEKNVSMFFRDPMQDPGVSQDEEQDSEDVDEDSFKFGRNMRASNGHFGMQRKKNVHELMNSRMKLLQQQRDQQVLVDQEVLSEKAATALVNNLLLQGFNISGPQNGAQPEPFHLPPPVTEEKDGEDENIFPVKKEKLIGAIQKELKRVQGQASETQ